MGILFNVAKLNTKKVAGVTVTSVEVDSTAAQPCPLMSVAKCTVSGTANKIATPFKKSGQYKTSWVPMGQDGWKIQIQAMLRYHEDTGLDEIAAWLKIDTGQLLYVQSNKCNMQGKISLTGIANEKIPIGSLWYIDKITISSKKGILQLADMELTLYRCWTEVVDNGTE